VRLADLLVRQLATEGPHDLAAIEARLNAATSDAAARWPGATVSDERYAAWIAERLPEGGAPIEQKLEALRLVELYLACACAAGDAKALAAFDATFIAGAGVSDDVKQGLRTKLFLAALDGRPARIASYGGRGDLARWVQAIATRMAIDEVRAQRDVPTEQALLDAIGVDADPGSELLRRDAKLLLQTAMREAVATLGARERSMLLQYYLDGVGVVALGKFFKIAPSSVSRTLAKTLALLMIEMRRALIRNGGVSRDELERLADFVGSQLSLTSGLRRDVSDG
jgi:RNA polymerase sigma-70 factor (ECF subfamily)